MRYDNLKDVEVFEVLDFFSKFCSFYVCLLEQSPCHCVFSKNDLKCFFGGNKASVFGPLAIVSLCSPPKHKRRVELVTAYTSLTEPVAAWHFKLLHQVVFFLPASLPV